LELLTPPPDARIIRVTERHSYSTCKRKWKYGYLDNLEPIDRKPGARELGTAMHKCLEAYYGTTAKVENKHNKDKKVWTQDEREGLLWKVYVETIVDLEDEQADLLSGMLENYLKQYADEAYEPFLTEYRLYAPIPGLELESGGAGVWLSAKADGLGIFNDCGRYSVVDHKSYVKMITEVESAHDDQMTAYMWVLYQNGIKVKDGVYNILLKSVPSPPKVLQSGKLSIDKGMNCDKQTYIETLNTLGIDHDSVEYRERLDFAVATLRDRSAYFGRPSVYRTPNELKSFEENLVYQAQEMVSSSTWLGPTHSMKECPFCDFKSLCKAEDNRESTRDIERIKLTEYKPRENTLES
jgi:CRISPR/Cas system-associated exonuclease Cas4 (RecB family)